MRQKAHSCCVDVPLGWVARPEEIARAVVFLARDNPSDMTGAVLAVDGRSAAVQFGAFSEHQVGNDREVI